MGESALAFVDVGSSLKCGARGTTEKIAATQGEAAKKMRPHA